MRTGKLTVLALACSAAASGAAPPAFAAAPKPAAVAASKFIAGSAKPEVGNAVAARVFSKDGRNVFRYAQSYAGFPVWQRGASVTVTDAGSVLGQQRRFSRHFGPSTPQVDPAKAAKIASIAGRVEFSPSHATTLWFPMKTQARLAHAFYRGAVFGLPFAPLVVVDAVSGAVLLRLNMVRFDRLAMVHENNPTVSPQPTQVVLSALEPGAKQLENAAFSVQNCIDKGSLSGGQFSIRMCEFEQTAVADAQGDFPQAFTAHDEMEDAHAEVAMFYHLTKAHAYYESLGLKGLKSIPTTAIVNVRMPPGYAEGDFEKMQDPSLPLEPFNNAFYTPEAPFGPKVGPAGASLWFGQGLTTDFSYDGDVVAHELGHGVVDSTIDFVGYFQMDRFGSWPAAGAMNEGISDFLSAAVSGDPQIGEYAAKSFIGEGAQNIRDLSNNHKCPSALAGEVHVDSTVFSGALWVVRATLDVADQHTFDEVVFKAMVAAPSGDIDFKGFADVIMAELALSSLGTGIADALEAELTLRGILPECARVLDVGKNPVNGPSSKLAGVFIAPGFDVVPVPLGSAYVPGVMQFHRKLPLGTEKLKVLWAHRDSSRDFGGTPYAPALLVRFDETPIEFTYGAELQSNAQLVDVTRSAAFFSVDIPIDSSIRDVHVMIVNRGETEGMYSQLSLMAITPKPLPLPGSGGTGGALPTVPSGGSSAASDLSPAGGCSVSLPGGRGCLWWAAASLLLLQRRRRR